jgi:hypothetical protein
MREMGSFLQQPWRIASLAAAVKPLCDVPPEKSVNLSKYCQPIVQPGGGDQQIKVADEGALLP